MNSVVPYTENSLTHLEISTDSRSVRLDGGDVDEFVFADLLAFVDGGDNIGDLVVFTVEVVVFEAVSVC